MHKTEKQELQKSFFDAAAWRYFGKFYQGQYRPLILNSIVSAAQSLIVVPTLLLIRYAFDYAIPQRNFNVLVLIGIGIFTLRLANSGVSLWLSARNINIIRTAIFRLREDLLIRLYKFSRAFHTRVDQKTMHARIVQDTERLSNMSGALVSRIMPSLFTGLALCFVLLSFNWFLFLVMVLIVPALFLANRYTSKLVKKRVYVFQRAFEKFSKGMSFVLRYMDLTRIQFAEHQEIERQTMTLMDLRDTSKRMAFIYAVHAQSQRIIMGISGIVILIVGGAGVAAETMTIGEFLSFYVAASFLNGRVNTITSSVADIIAGNESMVTLHRLAETKDIKPYYGKKQIQFKGFLSLESVYFKYDVQPVLENVNLRVNPDSKIAIIGSNGTGKSTIIHLILGFYKPCRGKLCADNVPYEEVNIECLRRSIGVVTQHPPLFPGTILENIAYGAPALDREQIITASRYALADEFIQQLPEGYDTQIGEDGVLLSGGECQRIAIARALLRRPKLLILDEPTNHLDRAAVGKVMNSLDNLEECPAILLISHDMGVVSHATEVYQLDKGVLVSHVPVSLAT